MKVLVAQSCPTLCDPMTCSLPASSVHGILQVRILEWVAVPFSRGSSQLRDRTHITQGRRLLHHLSRQGSPSKLEWVACPFSRGSSQPRNRTGVSYIASRFFLSHLSYQVIRLKQLFWRSKSSCPTISYPDLWGLNIHAG